MIWIYAVCEDRAYPDSAGPGLSVFCFFLCVCAFVPSLVFMNSLKTFAPSNEPNDVPSPKHKHLLQCSREKLMVLNEKKN